MPESFSATKMFISKQKVSQSDQVSKSDMQKRVFRYFFVELGSAKSEQRCDV